MTQIRLEELLREVPIPPSTRAREQAVVEARAHIAARGTLVRPTPAGRRLGLCLAVAAVLIAVVLLTPPGRTASAWVGELIGIGEVGGSPTQKQRGFQGKGPAVVIDNGTAPDGSRYEWVAYRCGVDLRKEGLPDRIEGIGLSFEWPDVKGHEGEGSCETEAPAPEIGRGFSSHGVHILPSQFKGVEEPDLVVSGSTGPGVHGVRVIYTDGEGDKHELPVDFARVEGKLRELAQRSEPLGTFVAFVPGEWAARDELESRLDLRALETTGKLKLGPLGRRERAAARAAVRECRHKLPDPTALPDPPSERAMRRAYRPYSECMEERMPPSPFEYLAYDERGRVLERQTEPLVAARMLPPLPQRAAGRERPGQKRGHRPTQGVGYGPPVVLVSGRAPDGALYEFFAQTFERKGKLYGNCVTLWWPYAPRAAGGGTCGPGFPPSTAFGRRENIAAKPYGFLTEAPAATRHKILSGYARPNVSRVRVVYRGRSGDWQDAPVRLRRVTGSLRERLDADRPFGFFVSFLPPSVSRHYPGSPPRRAVGRPAIVVIAYNEEGREVSRVNHRN
jgi:hypothetical protein